jgi:hypothetical protein
MVGVVEVDGVRVVCYGLFKRGVINSGGLSFLIFDQAVDGRMFTSLPVSVVLQNDLIEFLVASWNSVHPYRHRETQLNQIRDLGIINYNSWGPIHQLTRKCSPLIVR